MTHIMYRIDIANAQTDIDMDEAFLREVTERTLSEERVAEADVSIALVDNAAIRDLNRRYRNHDDATDVLSFLLDCESSDSNSSPPSSPPLAKGGLGGAATARHQESPPCGPPSQGGQSKDDVPRGAGKRIEGEVILSAEMAARRAAEFSWPPHDELVLYLVHGLLHLAGYDDQSPEERTVMRSRERTLLKHWNLVSEPESFHD